MGLLHGGLLHVLPLGEHLVHQRHVVHTHGRQAHVAPGGGRGDREEGETQRHSERERERERERMVGHEGWV